MKKTLIWIKRDLRLVDQPLLRDLKDSSFETHLVYLRFMDEEKLGSLSQRAFRQNCLTDFSARTEHEVSLIDTTSETFLVDIEMLLNTVKPEKLVTSTEFAARLCERNSKIRVLCEKYGIEFQEINTFSIFPEPNLHELPRVFTDFRKKIETERVQFDDLDPLQQNEEQSPGFSRLMYYLFHSKRISTYRLTRNGMIDPDDSSHFSPFLSVGALSAKRIWFEIDRYETEVEANDSTYWLKFELLWREFFLWNAKKYQESLFQLNGIRQRPVSFHQDEALFNSWKMGQTPDAFVNANMNELRLTGWMSNRGRQNVASYLVHDLGLDWREGALWFEQQLIDEEPCANWGNWSYLAGVGNDPRPFRKFNLELQRSQYDPSGEYVKKWTKV